MMEKDELKFEISCKEREIEKLKSKLENKLQYLKMEADNLITNIKDNRNFSTNSLKRDMEKIGKMESKIERLKEQKILMKTILQEG